MLEIRSLPKSYLQGNRPVIAVVASQGAVLGALVPVLPAVIMGAGRMTAPLYPSGGFVRGIADRLDRALAAERLAGVAHRPAVMDELVGKDNPLFLGNAGHQVLLDLDRVGLLGEVEAAG